MIKDLKEINRKEVNLFGGKAANLGFLIQNNFDVPAGFCISSRVNKMTQSIKNEVIRKYRKLKSRVSVRSSANVEDAENASFAGQFDSFLNISSKKQLLDSINKCWMSAKSEKVSSYLSNKSIKKVKMAVIVQKMVDAKFAGVIFTKDPIHKKYLLVEIVEGLGDKLVSGKVTPTSFLIDKKGLNIKQKNDSLNIKGNLIKSIATIGLKIEKAYNVPQDIEFAIDKNDKIWILQSRPITTL